MYDQIENVRFLFDKEKGLYWTFLRDIKPIYDEIMPYLESNHPEIKKQYDAIFDFFYSDKPFFMEEYKNLMPIS